MDMNELNRDHERDRLVSEWNELAPRYDSFPTTLQLVKEPRLVTSVLEALYTGKRIGYCSITRQVANINVGLKGFEDMFPGDVLTYHTVYVTRPEMIGTGELGVNHNFQLVARRDSQLWVAEIGCFHAFVQSMQSNCYHEHRCTKCGYGYAVDSSG